ncbi:ABC-2 type transport system permease protein [Haloferula luteola]|uniref:ABC-2 type transport system permease protein n=1 Tax=Haloferula luteola TaxID=595692 RepID=A0A840V307_9BACT|nr:ABC transporter permease [Haloferula luteola]MBB5350044.1 ABC-2 type transport system permease protein [Haloferula luteola]
MFHPAIVRALVMRQVLLYTRNPVRAIELFFWPIVQLLVWGFVTVFLQQQSGGGQEGFGRVITFLIGAIILWDSLFRSQQGVAISFLEDVWTRNLLNVFAAPIRMTEYLAASFTVGLLRVIITGIVLFAIALAAYSFNLFQFQGYLFVFYANLMMFGWTLGILSTALVLRWGHGVESLAWAIPFMVQPFACVFYDISVLPSWMQGIALAMPPAHIFGGMREMVATGSLNLSDLAWAVGLNFLYLAFASALFSRTLGVARERGLLVKTASS